MVVQSHDSFWRRSADKAMLLGQISVHLSAGRHIERENAAAVATPEKSPNLGPGIGNLLSEKHYQIEDSTSWTHGKHSFKFGLSFRPAKYHQNNPLYSTSQIVYFSNLFNLYGLGGPDCATAGLNNPSGLLPLNTACVGAALGSYTPPLTATDLSAISS